MRDQNRAISTNSRYWGCFRVLPVVVPLLIASHSTGATDIVRSITTSKDVYLLGEPVVVQVMVSNTTATAQVVNIGVEMGRGYAGYYTSTDGVSFVEVPCGIALDAAGRMGELGAGKAFHHDQGLLYDLRQEKLLFSSPVDYFVKITFGPESPRLANGMTARIRVVAPSSVADRQALAVVNDPKVLESMTCLPDVPPKYGLADPDNHTLKKLRQISDGQSTYALYAAYLLSLYEADPNNALALLTKADRADFPLRAHVVYRKGEVYLKLEQHQKAVEQFERIKQDFPSSAAATKLVELQKRTGRKLTREEARQQDEKLGQSKAQEERLAKAQQVFANSGERPKVEAAVRRFMAAHVAGRVEECDEMMADNFVHGGSMDRAKSLAKMQKEFEKLKGKKLEAIPTFDSVTTDGTNVTVAVSVDYRYEGEERSQKESYTLRQEQGQWKVSRQAITYSEPPPPGFPPHAPAPKQ